MSSRKPFLRVVESSENFFQGVWRRNDNLVIAKDAVFPDRCIVCNHAAHGRSIRKVFVWHSPLLLPLIVLSFPLYFMLAFLWRKILRVDLPVCKKHRNQILFRTSCAFMMMPQFFIMGAFGLFYNLPPLILVGLITSIAGVLLLIIARNPVWAWFIRSDYGLIKGAHPDFISSLPEWDQDSI